MKTDWTMTVLSRKIFCPACWTGPSSREAQITQMTFAHFMNLFVSRYYSGFFFKVREAAYSLRWVLPILPFVTGIAPAQGSPKIVVGREREGRQPVRPLLDEGLFCKIVNGQENPFCTFWDPKIQTYIPICSKSFSTPPMSRSLVLQQRIFLQDFFIFLTLHLNPNPLKSKSFFKLRLKL